MAAAGGGPPSRPPSLTGRAPDGRRARGLGAEDRAAAHLEAHGLRILARNWRRPEGELDLVAEEQGTCVFVEVRARTGLRHGHPLEAISRRKQLQVIRAARLYLAEERPGAASFRFDVVGVLFPEGGDAEAQPAELFWIRDAFDSSRG